MNAQESNGSISSIMKNLGQPLRTYGINLPLALWNAALSASLVGLFIGLLASGIAIQNTLAMTVITAVIVVVILVYIFIRVRKLRQIPAITVHENGIRIQEKDMPNDWLWSELNGLESPQSFSLRFGSNYGDIHITANGVRAFTVNGYTRHSVELVDLLQVKLAQNLAPDLAKLYAEKDNLNLPPLWLSSAGIRVNNTLTPWSDIGPLQLKHEAALLGQAQLVTEHPITKKLQKLADINKGYAYHLLAVLDLRDKTSYLDTEATRLLAETSRTSVTKFVRTIPLVVASIIVYLVIMLLPHVQTWYQQIQDANARGAFAATYGSVATLCDTAEYGTTDLLIPAEPRYLIMDEGTGVEHSSQQALRPARRATSGEDVTTIVCVTPTTEEVDSCSFTADRPRNGVEETFYVALVESRYDITVVDVASGQIAHETVLEGEQLACPSRVENRLDIFGAPPLADDLLQWLKDMGYAP